MDPGATSDDSDLDDPDPTPFEVDDPTLFEVDDPTLFELDESEFEYQPDSTTHEVREDSIPKEMLKPLYPGSVLSVCAAYCLIMQFAIASKLSYTAIENLMKLLQLLCPSSNILPSSFYQLKKFFKQYTPSYEKKRVCPECKRILKDGEHCPRDHGGSGHVVQIPIEKALRTIVQSKLTFPLRAYSMVSYILLYVY